MSNRAVRDQEELAAANIFTSGPYRGLSTGAYSVPVMHTSTRTVCDLVAKRVREDALYARNNDMFPFDMYSKLLLWSEHVRNSENVINQIGNYEMRGEHDRTIDQLCRDLAQQAKTF